MTDDAETSSLLHKLNSFPRKVRVGSRCKPLPQIVAKLCESSKKRKVLVTLEELIDNPDALIIDDTFVDVLAQIARTDSEEDGRRMFNKLMGKDFSCSSMRPHLEEKLEVEEVIRLANYGMQLLGRSSINKAHDQFEKALEICMCLLDSCCRRFAYKQEQGKGDDAKAGVGEEDEQAGHAEAVNQQLAFINHMVESCEAYSRIEALAKTKEELPRLFDAPRCDYTIHKVRLSQQLI